MLECKQSPVVTGERKILVSSQHTIAQTAQLPLPEHVAEAPSIQAAFEILRNPNINAAIVVSRFPELDCFPPALRHFVETTSLDTAKARNCDLSGVKTYLEKTLNSVDGDHQSLLEKSAWLREMLDITEAMLKFTGKAKVIDVLLGNNSPGPFPSQWHIDTDLLVASVDYLSAGTQYVANSDAVYRDPWFQVLDHNIRRVPPRRIIISKGTSVDFAESNNCSHGLVHRRPPQEDPVYPYTNRMFFLVGVQMS